MPKILAIETATNACSAALLDDDANDGVRTIKQFKLAPREHTKLILPMMESVLEEGGVEKKDLDVIAFSRGPGAFTGLRIAAGIAQGLAFALDIPVAPVSTLAALAFDAVDRYQTIDGDWQDDVIIAALDARMGEVYWGVFIYQGDTISAISKERVSKPEELRAMLAKRLVDTAAANVTLFVIGSGWDVYEDDLFKDGKADRVFHIKDAYPSAEFIAELAIPMLIHGETVPAEGAQPVYIRNKVAEKPKKK